MFDDANEMLKKSFGIDLEQLHTYPIYLTIQEASEGAKKQSVLRVNTPCNACNGTGKTGLFKCKACKGTAVVPQNVTVWIDVSPNTQNGDMLNFTCSPEEADRLPDRVKFIANINDDTMHPTVQAIHDSMASIFGNSVKPSLKYHLTLTSEEARLGCEKEIQYQIQAPCTQCSGKGLLKSENRPCGACNGSGFIDGQTETYTVKVPKNIQTGMGMRVKGKGDYISGRKRGELLIEFDVV